MSNELTPILDQFVVEEMQQTLTQSTILLLKKSFPVQQGKVVAVSDGYYSSDEANQKTPPPVKVGDVVVFPKGSGYEFELAPNKKRIMLKYEHILGKVS